MHLENGVYEIRYVPKNINPPFVGGLYATSKDLGGPIYGEPIGQPGSNKWQVTRGADDTYLITSPELPQSQVQGGPGPILPGWGMIGQVAKYNDLVLFKAPPASWNISATDTKDVYTIGPSDIPKEMGVTYVVGLDKNNDALCIKTVAVVFPPPPTPYWQFIKVAPGA